MNPTFGKEIVQTVDIMQITKDIFGCSLVSTQQSTPHLDVQISSGYLMLLLTTTTGSGALFQLESLPENFRLFIFFLFFGWEESRTICCL